MTTEQIIIFIILGIITIGSFMGQMLSNKESSKLGWTLLQFFYSNIG